MCGYFAREEQLLHTDQTQRANEIMKALVLRELKTPLKLEEPSAPTPGPGEVVVRLMAAALNRRDYWITQGMYPGIGLPVILGSDGAGIVTTIGAGVPPHWSNQEVIINPGFQWGEDQRMQGPDFQILGMPRAGTFADEVVVPAESLHARPAHLDWHEAAALPLSGVTAYRAVFTQGQVKRGENVLVSGIGGGVATYALQFAKAAGANVFVTSSSQDKLKRATELGAIAGYDYRSEGWAKQLRSEHGAVDLIIDGAGGPGYGRLVDLAAQGGRIVNYGATAGPAEKFDLLKVFWKQLRIIGTTMGSPTDFQQMLELFNEHQLRPVIDEVLPLARGNDALQRMGDSTQFGNLVLEIG